MCYCYSCNKPLYDWNKSEEHIIPNALGGKLKSDSILCVNCNSDFGETLDSLLAGYINLPTLLDVTRDRGNPPKVAGFTKSGGNYNINNKLIPEKAKVLTKKLPDGKRSIIVRNEKEARKILKKHKKKNPNIDIEQELKKIKWKEEYIEEPVYFKHDILSGQEAMRAIAKIAVNYYCSSLHDTVNISHIIPFLKNETKLYIVYHFFPEPPIYIPSENEISHLLYLKGNNKENLLYCYIELFNCHTLLVILNDNYKGFNFEESYIYDLESKEEKYSTISFNLSRNELDKMTTPGPENSQELFFQKLSAVFEKKGIEFIHTPKEK